MTDNAPAAADGARVIVVSGLSGGGKSTALHALEDLGYYCVDNLPAALLDDFADQVRARPALYRHVALGIDARSVGDGADALPGAVQRLSDEGLDCRVLFLTADRNILLSRFSETRRRHPLTGDQTALPAAIEREEKLLEPLRRMADWVIDTSDINIHQLRRQVWKLAGEGGGAMTLVLESFAFKRGVPQDVDFLFDVRHLPNPHWQESLRPLTGIHPDVRAWLEQDDAVLQTGDDIAAFLQRWLPAIATAQRSYLTVGIGCTGGRHRSVYLVERLAERLRAEWPGVLVHHRELGP